jgi:hypothetical protein
VPEGQALRWYKSLGRKGLTWCFALDDRREVCLEEEVERLRRFGMSTREIARAMGLDEGWVESLISMSADEDSSAENHG